MTAPENPPEYNPAIPQPNNTIDDGQTDFLGNFETLFAAFGTNHVALNDLTNPGNHNIIQLVEQTLGKATKSQEICFYTKKVADQTDQLWMRYPSNGKEFQLSQYQIYHIGDIFFNGVKVQEAYFTFLPGGVIVYFGKIIPFGNPFYLSLQPAICTNIISINLCPIGPVGTDYQSNVALELEGNKYSFIKLTSVPNTPPNQYYLAFGNI